MSKTIEIFQQIEEVKKKKRQTTPSLYGPGMTAGSRSSKFREPKRRISIPLLLTLLAALAGNLFYQYQTKMSERSVLETLSPPQAPLPFVDKIAFAELSLPIFPHQKIFIGEWYLNLPMKSAPLPPPAPAAVTEVPAAHPLVEKKNGVGFKELLQAFSFNVTPPPQEAAKPVENPVSASEPYFTIQLITYKSDSRAAQEIKKLNDQGEDAFLVSDGRTSSVCLGKFQDKSAASQKLRTLKNPLHRAYHDAYVRRVKVS